MIATPDGQALLYRGIPVLSTIFFGFPQNYFYRKSICYSGIFFQTGHTIFGDTMIVLQELLIAATGGGCYILIELLWRGRSHISMFFLGGLCFWLIGQMNRTHTAPVAIQAILGAAMVTALELLTGLVVNRWLGLGVWDYSAMPMNFLGQICLRYFLLWIPLSAAAVFAEDGLRWLLFRTPLPPYRLL